MGYTQEEEEEDPELAAAIYASMLVDNPNLSGLEPPVNLKPQKIAHKESEDAFDIEEHENLNEKDENEKIEPKSTKKAAD